MPSARSAFLPTAAKRHRTARAQRRILQGPIDLSLQEHRLIAIRSASGGQKMKLVTIPAGPMTCPRISGVDPQRHSIRTSWSSRIPPRLLIFAGYFDPRAKP